MKICFISDTHGTHKRLTLPEADVLCHCGDFVRYGSFDEIVEFLKWFSTVGNFKYRILIAGNHEKIIERNPSIMDITPSNIHYLFDSAVTIEGIKFYGTPWQPLFCNWAFNLSEEGLAEKFKLIPDDVDVLLSHGPPYNILDKCEDGYLAGSRSLLIEILGREPKVVAFGHIHEAHGMITLYDGIKFINASVLNARYELVNEPTLVEI